MPEQQSVRLNPVGDLVSKRFFFFYTICGFHPLKQTPEASSGQDGNSPP